MAAMRLKLSSRIRPFWTIHNLGLHDLPEDLPQSPQIRYGVKTCRAWKTPCPDGVVALYFGLMVALPAPGRSEIMTLRVEALALPNTPAQWSR
jgi:hypothetical protein